MLSNIDASETVRTDDEQIHDHHHHTSQYQSEMPFYRRGFPFTIKFQNVPNFPGRFQKAELVCYPDSRDDQSIRIPLTKTTSSVKNWFFNRINTQDSSIVSFEITSPADCHVGIYVFRLISETYRSNSNSVVLIFNPWCKDDDCYMKNEDERNEYVLEEHTHIPMGTSFSYKPTPWYLAQFTSYSVTSALSLLKNLQFKDRNSLIAVSRYLSSVVNANNGYGILIGNWTGKYSDGTNPVVWSGSHDILRKWVVSGSDPVKYAQCWVYAGVLCTVCRTLGIPCRIITNFNSYHDKTGTCFWKVIIDSNNRVIHDDSNMIWNFHCWNEVYFNRSDKQSLSGWQVIDATPQEKSDEAYCLGPTSKYAVKEGEIEERFDTRFVFAEVNADRAVYLKTITYGLQLLRLEDSNVGNKILTKYVGQDADSEITNEYKYRNNKVFENLIRNEVWYKTMKSEIRYSTQDLSALIKCDPVLNIGNDFVISVEASCHLKRINGRLTVDLCTYNGKILSSLLDKEVTSLTNILNQTFKIDANIIQKSIDAENMFLKCNLACSTNSNDFVLKQQTVRINIPDIEIEAPSTIYVEESWNLKVKVDNLLTRPLLDAKIYIISDGIRERIKIRIGDIAASGTWSQDVPIIMTSSGKKTIYASLSSNILVGLGTSIKVSVNTR